MKKTLFVCALVAVGSLISSANFAQTKGAGKDVMELVSGSPNHTTLTAALKLADLTATLKDKGPFTVFAPNDAAFEKLAPEKLESLLKPENKAQLTKVLTYHVVGGVFDGKAVLEAIKSGGGKAMLTTMSGGKLTASLDGAKIKLTDELGGSSYVAAADLVGSNGVIHVLDSVLMPKEVK